MDHNSTMQADAKGALKQKKQFALHRGTEKTRVWGEPLSQPMGEPGNSDFSFNFQLCASVPLWWIAVSGIKASKLEAFAAKK